MNSAALSAPVDAPRPIANFSPIAYIRYSRIANTGSVVAGSKSNPQVVLRPQDLVVLLRLALERGPAPAYAALAADLGMTASEVHGAVERAVIAQLAHKDPNGKAVVIFAALRLFVQQGARYSFPATRGSLTRGRPTGYAAPPLNASIRPGPDPVPVWPHKNGTVRGVAFHPLYPSVPDAAVRNPALYELLALFDAIRGGNARERKLAIDLLDKRLQA